VPLIVNADDFGLTPGVNRSIAELRRAGALSSATLMATGAFFDDAVATAKANRTSKSAAMSFSSTERRRSRPSKSPPSVPMANPSGQH
jgi:hypothetical protein